MVQSRIDTGPPASLGRRNYRHLNRLFQERERAIEQAKLAVVFADRRYHNAKMSREEKRKNPALLFRRPHNREAGHDRLQPNLFAAEEIEQASPDTMPQDLHFHLGAEPVPVGQRRVPPVLQDVRSRVAAVQRAQSARGAREWEAPTRKERAMLWGTSLAPVPQEACQHPAVCQPASPTARMKTRRRRAEAQEEEEERWKAVREALLDKLLQQPLSEATALKEVERVWKDFDGREGGRTGLRACLCRLLKDLSLSSAAKTFVQKHPLH